MKRSGELFEGVENAGAGPRERGLVDPHPARALSGPPRQRARGERALENRARLGRRGQHENVDRSRREVLRRDDRPARPRGEKIFGARFGKNVVEESSSPRGLRRIRPDEQNGSGAGPVKKP